MKRLCQWILYGLMGWKKDITQEHPDKYIICLAPHTSNWDFIIGQLFAMAEGMHTNFLMKKEWFFWLSASCSGAWAASLSTGRRAHR